VLLVEDECRVAIVMQDSLEQLGCEVVGCAASAAEAEQLATESWPDVVLMDVGLKGPVDGIDAALRLRQHLAAPIIFVTGRPVNEIRERMGRVASSAMLRKPFTDDELRGALVWACGQR
jgi:CheY-like chemotaxis protein